LKNLFLSNDFSRTRPFRPAQAPFDHVQAARKQGTNIVQSFHSSMDRKGGHFYNVLCDICAFANTNGGTAYVGLSDNLKKPVNGVNNPQASANLIRSELEKRITPPLDIELDQHVTQGKKVLQVVVPVGKNPPYVIDDYKIYVRDETDTNLAVRDEIVALVKRSLKTKGRLDPPQVDTPQQETTDIDLSPPGNVSPEPKTGVEIVLTEARKGKNFYSLRDLRNGDIVHNVTRQSARKLWQYALTQHETNQVDPEKVEWMGDIGMWKKQERAGQVRYDLVQRDADQNLHVYYGVTENGLHGPWQKLFDIIEDNGDK